MNNLLIKNTNFDISVGFYPYTSPGVGGIVMKIKGVREPLNIHLGGSAPLVKGKIPQKTLAFAIEFFCGKKFHKKLWRAMVARQADPKEVQISLEKMRVALATLI